MPESPIFIHSKLAAVLRLVLVHDLVYACDLAEVVISDQPR